MTRRPARLSSAHHLLKGWAPPQFGGRTIVRVEVVRGSVRRIVFDRGRARRISKQNVALLARQKGSVIASERYASATPAEKRRLTRKGLKRQLTILNNHINRAQALIDSGSLESSAGVKQAMRNLVKARKQVRPPYGGRKGIGALDAIARIWQAAGIQNPVLPRYMLKRGK